MKRSKRYQESLSQYDRAQYYSLNDAVATLKTLSKAKFDETVDVAIKLGIDYRKSDQVIRGALSLPHGTGKNVTVVVIAEEEHQKQAKEANADFVGLDDLIDKIKDGWLDFDVLIATPSSMKKVRTLARILGPRNLMPNPKVGTVTDDVASAVKSSKAGRINYKTGKGAVCHVIVGKVSFDVEKLVENTKVVIEEILRVRPSSTKGQYLLSCVISSTMSPSIKVDLKDIVGSTK